VPPWPLAIGLYALDGTTVEIGRQQVGVDSGPFDRHRLTGQAHLRPGTFGVIRFPGESQEYQQLPPQAYAQVTDKPGS
jgi:hypothetical protein